MNTLFTGTYQNKVDSKGRVSLPADFRDSLKLAGSDRTFYIFPSPVSHCLEAAGESFINKLVYSIEQQSDLFSDNEDQYSLLLAQAKRTIFDSTGRFVIDMDVVNQYELTQSALFVGRGRRFQIWNTKKYTTHVQKIEKQKIHALKLTSKSGEHHG